jgi:hypothetical protein
MVENYYSVLVWRRDVPNPCRLAIAQHGDNPGHAERLACKRRAAFCLGSEEYAHLWAAECEGLVYPAP